MLSIFPACEVSHVQLPHVEIADPAWNVTAVRLIGRTGASALPIYFCGRTAWAFRFLGMIHSRLRSAFLLNEFLQQQGKVVEVRVGSEIPADCILGLPNDREGIEYLCWRSYLLGRRRNQKRPGPWRFVPSLRPSCTSRSRLLCGGIIAAGIGCASTRPLSGGKRRSCSLSAAR